MVVSYEISLLLAMGNKTFCSGKISQDVLDLGWRKSQPQQYVFIIWPLLFLILHFYKVGSVYGFELWIL